MAPCFDGHGCYAYQIGPFAATQILEYAADDVAQEQQYGRQDSGSREDVIVELCEEVSRKAGQPSRAVVGLQIVSRPEENLVLLLVKEMVWIAELEERPTASSPQDDQP